MPTDGRQRVDSQTIVNFGTVSEISGEVDQDYMKATEYGHFFQSVIEEAPTQGSTFDSRKNIKGGIAGAITRASPNKGRNLHSTRYNSLQMKDCGDLSKLQLDQIIDSPDRKTSVVSSIKNKMRRNMSKTMVNMQPQRTELKRILNHESQSRVQLHPNVSKRTLLERENRERLHRENKTGEQKIMDDARKALMTPIGFDRIYAGRPGIMMQQRSPRTGEDALKKLRKE